MPASTECWLELNIGTRFVCPAAACDPSIFTATARVPPIVIRVASDDSQVVTGGLGLQGWNCWFLGHSMAEGSLRTTCIRWFFRVVRPPASEMTMDLQSLDWKAQFQAAGWISLTVEVGFLSSCLVKQWSSIDLSRVIAPSPYSDWNLAKPLQKRDGKGIPSPETDEPLWTRLSRLQEKVWSYMYSTRRTGIWAEACWSHQLSWNEVVQKQCALEILQNGLAWFYDVVCESYYSSVCVFVLKRWQGEFTVFVIFGRSQQQQQKQSILWHPSRALSSRGNPGTVQSDAGEAPDRNFFAVYKFVGCCSTLLNSSRN